LLRFDSFWSILIFSFKLQISSNLREPDVASAETEMPRKQETLAEMDKTPKRREKMSHRQCQRRRR
jgi:hypothetical protein